jgi:hypothetical protein
VQYSFPEAYTDTASITSTGHIVPVGQRRYAYKILIENPEGRRLLGRPRRRWDDNAKMNLKVILSGSVD